MSTLLMIARFALAAVFTLAALGKLADRAGSRRTLEDFGVPETLAGAGRVGLPLAELTIAAGLIVVNSAAWAAVAATVVLVGFCAVIARSLARGATPDCHCFGRVGSAPVGRGTLARNAGLIALAGFVAIAGWNDSGDSVAGLTSGLGVATIVLGVAIGVQAIFSWQLFQQNGRLLQRLSKLEATIGRSTDDEDDRPLAVGTRAPMFALPDLEGSIRSLDELAGNGRGVLLVFTDPACAHCDPLLPALGSARTARQPPVVVISRGDHGDNAARAQEHGIAPLLLQQDFEVAEAYRVFGSPAAILLDSDGRVASPAAVGQQAVGQLLQATSTTLLPLVQPAPGRGALVEASPV